LREKHNKEKGTSLLLCIPLYSGKAKFPAPHFRLIKQNPNSISFMSNVKLSGKVQRILYYRLSLYCGLAAEVEN
jgi:hypothetical protein